MTPDLLTLTQWLSPAFPVGGFAYSHGLETAIAAGEISDAASLQIWVGTILTEGAGRTDAILIAHALRPDADLGTLAAIARALAPSRERLAEAEEQGAAFLRTTNALTGTDFPAMPLPIAIAAAARTLALAPVEVIALTLHAFTSNLVQVGVRFIPLGQTAGQGVLAALHPLILRIAAKATTVPLNAIGSGAIRADLAAMQHETLDVRIFRT